MSASCLKKFCFTQLEISRYNIQGMTSERNWMQLGLMLFSAVVALMITIDVPYLLFLRSLIEPQTDTNLAILHIAAIAVLIVMCIVYATLVILKTGQHEANASLGKPSCGSIAPFFFLGFLLLLHFSLTITASQHLTNNARNDLITNVRQYWQFRTDSLEQRFVDDVQANLHCCGENGVEDYGMLDIPASCCNSQGCDAVRAYQTGCLPMISAELSSQGLLPIVASGLALLLLVLTTAGIIRIRYGNDRLTDGPLMRPLIKPGKQTHPCSI